MYFCICILNGQESYPTSWIVTALPTRLDLEFQFPPRPHP